MLKIATIGYEGANIADFVATLHAAGINTLIDVREIATSRRKGFAKTALSKALEQEGIRYVHLRGLGDPKPGRDAARAGNYEAFIEIFQSHLRSEQAKTDLEVAIALASEGDACLMCYERDPKTCHRSMVASEISAILGTEVWQLGVREGISKGDKRYSIRRGSSSRKGSPACGRSAH